MSFGEAATRAKEEARERNFTQSVDLVINLKELDLNDPENRFSEDIKLPYQADEDVTVCVIGETIINDADAADLVLTPDELDEVIDDQELAKEIAEKYDFFIAEAPLMPKIGKELGSVLGPRNKMPDPMQPGEDPSQAIEDLRRTVSVQLRESPSIKCKIGQESMNPDALGSNAQAVVDAVLDHLPRGTHNVKRVLLKLTMGPPVEVSV